MLNKFTAISQKLSPGLRKIIISTSWLTAERFLNMVISLSVGLYLIRYLGSENFGKLSYSVSFVGLFASIGKLGLDGIVVRNVVQEKSSTAEILGTAFILKLIGSLGSVVLIGWAIWSLNDNSLTRWMTLIASFGLVFNSVEVIDFWFKSKVLSGPISRVIIVQIILSSAAKLLFISFRLPVITFVWLMLADSIFKAAGTIAVYLKHAQSMFVWKVSWSRAMELLKDSWPLILSGITIAIYMKIDQVMLGNMAGDEVVGNYAAAVKFSELWYFIPTAICSSVFPAIIRAKQRSEDEYYSKLQGLYDLMAWLSLSIAITMTFVSNTLLTTLLGQDYARAGEILAVHIWAGPFVFLGVARGQWLMVENLTWFNFATTSLGSVINVLLNFWLIPSYGGIGAAIATVISYVVASHVACILYPPMFDTAWMLTKALFVPFRLRQNLIYLSNVKKIFP